jgi:hypothetical protein
MENTMRDRDREQDHRDEPKTIFERWLEKPSPNTEWAFQNVAGLYDDPGVYVAKILGATSKLRVVGGTSVVPLPIGHQMAVTVVPILRGHLFPANGRATAIFNNRQPTDQECKGAPAPRWGLAKPIITAIAAAACVRFIKVTVRELEAFYWKAEAFGYYRTLQGTRELTAERDCDFRDNSPQVAGKSAEAIAQLRATGARKAATGAKLRAIREALGIDHAVWEYEIDFPFVFASPVLTWRDKDPQIQTILAKGMIEMAMASQGVLWGQVPARGPALMPATPTRALTAAPSSNTNAAGTGAPSLFDDDYVLEPPPPALPPKAPPPPLQAGDAKRIRMPGKDAGTVADAGTPELRKAESWLRQGLIEGTWKAEYFDRSAVQLLTIRCALEKRGEDVEPCQALDELVAQSRRPAA